MDRPSTSGPSCSVIMQVIKQIISRLRAVLIVSWREDCNSVGRQVGELRLQHRWNQTRLLGKQLLDHVGLWLAGGNLGSTLRNVTWKRRRGSWQNPGNPGNNWQWGGLCKARQGTDLVHSPSGVPGGHDRANSCLTSGVWGRASIPSWGNLRMVGGVACSLIGGCLCNGPPCFAPLGWQLWALNRCMLNITSGSTPKKHTTCSLYTCVSTHQVPAQKLYTWNRRRQPLQSLFKSSIESPPQAVGTRTITLIGKADPHGHGMPFALEAASQAMTRLVPLRFSLALESCRIWLDPVGNLEGNSLSA